MPSDPPRHSTRREVLIAAIFMIMGIFGSRLLGLVRVQVQSWWFTPADAGALRAAFIVPDLLFYIIAGGALRSGFVPIFVRLLRLGRDDAESQKQAWWLFSVLVTAVTLLSIVIVALGVTFAGTIMAPFLGRWSGKGGFSDEAVALTVHLTRLLLPAQVFLLVGGVLSGTLDAMKRSRVTAVVPCLYNAAIILSMYLLRSRCGVQSAVYGVLVGGFLSNLVWQAWALAREGRELGIRYRPALDFRHPLVREMAVMAAPIVLGLTVAEINLTLAKMANAAYGEAAVAWFDNASRLARLPDGIFGAGLGIALFPYLSHLMAEGKEAEYHRQAMHVLRLAVICTVPLAALLACAPVPPVAILFGHGRYGPQDVANTATMLAWQAVGIVPLTLSVVLTRVFYARGDTMTPLRCGIGAIVFAALASLLSARFGGYWGPALAFSLACWFNAVQLFWAYGRAGGLDSAQSLWRSALLSHLAAGLAGGVGWLSLKLPGGNLAHAMASTCVILGTYVALLWWWKLDELATLVRMVKRRLRPSALGGAETEP
ncbi:MAG: murein biosynthesis integral membrane protein MurJ [Armatimonadetes bacterium]|nr:murein biosynthesis integral membrane protein MurJ [Armatimonadota bacterium]